MYVPVTERDRVVHAARLARAAFHKMRARLELMGETYGIERAADEVRVFPGSATDL